MLQCDGAVYESRTEEAAESMKEGFRKFRV